MSFPRLAFLALALGYLVVCVTGCVMRRTVTDGNQVISQGYVVKAPLIDR